ncbi:hypothetical protein CPAR01_07420 [Colletotrichum paranaense]|uniref:Uncharacterized protein n=1 Tax=Colletotrichum paranaense TaxID=1914294 RepID=A0ABQ9SQZ1_9PEZI|nr:uncharacterized protein CPAR01_07420 [Colletotrichum paranaense]KAK1541431.1 hypothetical protein CPAR01_07420 [Colletotrichum paranaense]
MIVADVQVDHLQQFGHTPSIAETLAYKHNQLASSKWQCWWFTASMAVHQRLMCHPLRASSASSDSDDVEDIVAMSAASHSDFWVLKSVVGTYAIIPPRFASEHAADENHEPPQRRSYDRPQNP